MNNISSIKIIISDVRVTGTQSTSAAAFYSHKTGRSEIFNRMTEYAQLVFKGQPLPTLPKKLR